MHYGKKLATGVESAGANILFACIDHNERADYIVVTLNIGGICVWTSSCNDLASLPPLFPFGFPDGAPSPGRGSPGTNPLDGVLPCAVPPSAVPSIVRVTVPSVLTLGNPKIAPRSLPTCGPATLSRLVPLASKVAELLTGFLQVVLGLPGGGPTCKKLFSERSDLSTTFTALAVLASEAEQDDTSCLKDSDQRLIQDLRTELPKLLGELQIALTRLLGHCSSPNTTPDGSAIPIVQSLFGSTGLISQLSPVLEPLTSQS